MEDVRFLSSLSDKIDFWSLPQSIGRNATALVAPENANSFRKTLFRRNITFTILLNDLEKTFEIERQHQNINFRRTGHRSISFDSYPRSNQIAIYLDQLAQDYPNLVTVVNQAVTGEYRQLKYVRISNSTGPKKNKTIIIDAGIHAREWIAPATALYVINQLVENAAQNEDLLNLFDWVVYPLANPDGYEYTHTNVGINSDIYI